VRDLIRELGWLNGAWYALDRLLRAVSHGRARLHKYYFMAQPVADKRWLPPSRGASLEVRQISASDAALKGFPRPAAVLPYRFEQGAICLGAFKAQRCIGFLWLALGPYREDEVRCRYVPVPQGQAAWDFDVYVDPEHRASLAFLRLWDEANRFLAARGMRWSLSRISAFNPTSISSHSRMAARRVGRAIFIALGSWQVSLSSIAPHFFLSRHADSFPVFLVHA
jgi:hypothetical protein